jgi:hypothetical protein
MEPKNNKRKVVDLNTKLVIIKHLDEGHIIRIIVQRFQ